MRPLFLVYVGVLNLSPLVIGNLLTRMPFDLGPFELTFNLMIASSAAAICFATVALTVGRSNRVALNRLMRVPIGSIKWAGVVLHACFLLVVARDVFMTAIRDPVDVPGFLLNAVLHGLFAMISIVSALVIALTPVGWTRSRGMCDACGYDLGGLHGGVCPECGDERCPSE